MKQRWAAVLLTLLAAVSMAGSQSASAVAPTTTLVSVAPGGGANASSGGESVSAGGHFVAFSSAASNIVAGDTNGVSDVFVRDTASGTTERITAPGGLAAYGRGISADGRFVLFGSHDPDSNISYLYLRDRSLQTTTGITIGDLGGSAMSRNGRYIGWGVTRFEGAVYLRDQVSGKVYRGRFGVAGDDMDVISVSNDGRTVLIRNEERNADRMWKPLSGRMLRFDQTYAGGYAKPYTYTYGVAVSANGEYVMFNSTGAHIVRGDTNRASDVFVRNLTNGHTTRISQTNSGRQANGASYGSDISGSGRFRLFNSSATNLVRGDTNANADLFVRDSTLRTTTRCDVASDGTQANAGSGFGALSPSGSWVAFESASSNLVPGDTNGFMDVFLRGPFCG